MENVVIQCLNSIKIETLQFVTLFLGFLASNTLRVRGDVNFLDRPMWKRAKHSQTFDHATHLCYKLDLYRFVVSETFVSRILRTTYYKRKQKKNTLGIHAMPEAFALVCFITLYDRLALFQPLPSKIKTNDLLARVFPRFLPLTCICLLFWAQLSKARLN